MGITPIKVNKAAAGWRSKPVRLWVRGDLGVRPAGRSPKEVGVSEDSC